MLRILPILILLIMIESFVANHAAEATPQPALLEAAGLSPVEPVAPAPTFALNDSQGRPMALDQHRGNVILINFWATWCPPCIHEMPLMNDLFLSMQGRPFSLWALNVQETQEDVTQFLKKRDFQFPILLDVDGKGMGRFQAKGLPSSYLIDCTGNLIGAVTGVLKWTDSHMQALLEALFKDAACQAKTASP